MGTVVIAINRYDSRPGDILPCCFAENSLQPNYLVNTAHSAWIAEDFEKGETEKDSMYDSSILSKLNRLGFGVVAAFQF